MKADDGIYHHLPEYEDETTILHFTEPEMDMNISKESIYPTEYIDEDIILDKGLETDCSENSQDESVRFVRRGSPKWLQKAGKITGSVVKAGVSMVL